jgi:hypothetical protein
MKRVLITGMSGTGQSSVIQELVARGIGPTILMRPNGPNAEEIRRLRERYNETDPRHSR